MTPKTPFAYLRKTISMAVFVTFMASLIQPPAYAQAVMPWMPKAGSMVSLSAPYEPANIKGLVIHPDNAMRFDFLIHRGDETFSQEEKKAEYNKLVKYFLASLAVPDEHQWVNLSPYEKDRMIKEDFGKTEMGRDLLAQDYILKQMTASMIYPESGLGQKFWEKVYAQAQEQFGTSDVPMNTFNKVWIVPDEAQIYEKGNAVYIVKQHLKVMLEEDYLSLSKHAGITNTAMARQENTNKLGSQIVREIVLPALEKEVNEGKNFAVLRQIYSGMILSAWYKNALKESLLGKVYADRSKVKGVDQPDARANQEIYQQYVKAFKKGVFNYIKEDIDRLTNQPIPRKYFSGGMQKGRFTDYAMAVAPDVGERAVGADLPKLDAATVDLQSSSDAAMTGASDISIQSYDALIAFVATPASRQGQWVAFDIDQATGLREPSVRQDVISALNSLIVRDRAFPAETRFFATYESSDMPQKEEGYIHVPSQLSQEELLRLLDAIREEFRGLRNWTVSFAVMRAEEVKGLGGMEKSLSQMLRQAKGFPKGTAWSPAYGDRTVADGFTYPRVVNAYVNPQGIDRELVTRLKGQSAPASFTGRKLGAVDALAGVRLAKDLVSQARVEDGRVVLPEQQRDDERQLVEQVRAALGEAPFTLGALDDLEKSIINTAGRVYGDEQVKFVRQILAGLENATEGGANPWRQTADGRDYLPIRKPWFEDKTDTVDKAKRFIETHLMRLDVPEWILGKLQLEVVEEEGRILGLAFSKGSMANTPDVQRGVVRAVRGVLERMDAQQPGVPIDVPTDYDVKVKRMVTAMRGKGVSVEDVQVVARLYASGRGAYPSVPPRNYGVIDSYLNSNGYRSARDAEKEMFLNDVARAMSPTDSAMQVRGQDALKPDNVGGIDLNAANLNMQIKRDGRGVPLPLSQQDINQLNRIEGLIPVIMQIKPAAALPVFAEISNKPLPASIS